MTFQEVSVRTLRQLSSELTEAMRDRTRPAVKTYLIEVLEAVSGGQLEDFLRRSLRAAAPRRRPSITRLPDQATIFEIRIGTLVLWLDTSDARIWELHSLGESGALRLLVDRWIAKALQLDVPWLPERLLNEASTAGEFVGFGLTYSRAFFAEDVGDIEFADSLTVRVTGSESRDALSQFRAQPTLGRSSALSGVRLRNPFAGPGAMAAGRLTSSLSSNGRVSSRGDSFERHRLVSRHAQRIYTDETERISKDYSVGALDENGEGLGGPLTIDLHSPVDDLAAFCGRLFAGLEPFRLWALLERRAADLIVANAIDLRTNRAFVVEAMPTELRVFLPSGVPGSVILRLVTLLQHHHDRRAELR